MTARSRYEERRDSQGSLYIARLYARARAYVCVYGVGVYRRVQNPRSTYGVKNIECTLRVPEFRFYQTDNVPSLHENINKPVNNE